MSMRRVILVAILGLGVGFSTTVTANESPSLSGFGTIAAQANPHNGSSTFAIPIELPPGRAGLQPNVMLNYSSSLARGLAGVGWHVELGHIARNLKDGPPDFANDRDFILVLNGAAVELTTSDGVNYHAKDEQAFLKIQFASNRWIVFDHAGTQYTFGENPSTRQDDQNNPARVYRWMLQRVEDVHRNYITYSYIKSPGAPNQNVIYPDTIDYTGFVSPYIAPYAQVKFRYQDVSNGSAYHFDARAGFTIINEKILQGIDVFAEDVKQRSYEMAYATSSTSGRDLLSQVTQFNGPGTQSLPPLRFTYQDEVLVGQDRYALHNFDNDITTGDNQWNMRFAGGYDREDSNYGPQHPQTSTGYYGMAGLNWKNSVPSSSFVNGPNGRLQFGMDKDYAAWGWTYLKVDQDMTLNVTIGTSASSSQAPDVAYGVWINDDSNPVTTQWNLKAGWNHIVLSGYHQHQAVDFKIWTDLATVPGVQIMNSSRVNPVTHTADVNGDGQTDLIDYDYGTQTLLVSIAQGESYCLPQDWMPAQATDSRLYFSDYNGDGFADFLSHDPGAGTLRMFEGTGSGFQDQGIWASNVHGLPPILGDYNGDGLIDLARINVDHFNPPRHIPSITYRLGIRYNLGDSFSSSEVGVFDNYDVTHTWPNIQAIPADMNGDGLTDMVYRTTTTGDYTIDFNHVDSALTLSVNGFYPDSPTSLVDVDHDGYVDLVALDTNTGEVWYRRNQGTSFAAKQKIPNISFSNVIDDDQLLISDFNGDGIFDLWLMREDGEYDVAYSRGQPSDILSQIDNSVGGLTDIAYTLASDQASTVVPFPIHVVETVTKTDAFTGSKVKTFTSYENGHWDTDDREFRGFGKVTTYQMSAAQDQSFGPCAVTFYHQDDQLKGRIDRQELRDSNGDLVSETIHTYAVDSLRNGLSEYVKTVRVDQISYDPTDSTNDRRVATEMFYDELPQSGQVTKRIEHGRIGLGGELNQYVGDERITTMSYVHNWSKRIIGLPAQTRVEDGSGILFRQSTFYYDHATSHTATPNLGMLTKKIDESGDDPNVIGDAHDPVTRYEYSGFGYLWKTWDPDNNLTEIRYDPTYQVVPQTTINAIGHRVVNRYYGIGEPQDDGLWGQLKNTTDPNNQAGSRIYDSFGRLIKTIGPKDTAALPTVEYDYVLAGDHSRITTRTRRQHGQTQVLSATQYFDGLGREIFTRSPSSTPGKDVITGERTYDAYGRIERQYINRLIDTGTMPDLNYSSVYTEFTYDASSRVVTECLYPSGFCSENIYKGWNLEAIDANGHKQGSFYDAYGRLVKREEFNGSDGRAAPRYPLTPYSVYATTQYVYDIEGQLLKTIDDHGNQTFIHYDLLGRKVAMEDPDMGNWTYDYDTRGNLISQTDNKNQTITFQYDALNRLLTKTLPGGEVVDYEYDQALVNGKGRLNEVQYPQGEVDFEYDELGRELKSIKDINGQAFAVSRNYNALNQLDNVSYPDAGQLFYSYDDAGQLKTVTRDAGPQPVVTRSRQVAGFIRVAVPAQTDVHLTVPFNREEAGRFVVDSIAAQTLTVRDPLPGGKWVNQYYVRVLTGPGRGLWSTIKLKSTQNLTIKDPEVAALIRAGDQFSVVRHFTLGYLFPKSDYGVSFTDGTQVLIYANDIQSPQRNPSAQRIAVYDQSLGRWTGNKVGPGAILEPETQFILRNHAQQALTFYEKGLVPDHDVGMVLAPESDLVVGTGLPVDVTLDESELAGAQRRILLYDNSALGINKSHALTAFYKAYLKSWTGTGVSGNTVLRAGESFKFRLPKVEAAGTKVTIPKPYRLTGTADITFTRQWIKAGEFLMTFATEVGKDYNVESSTDLISWQSEWAKDRAGTGKTRLFRKPITADKKFYRVRVSTPPAVGTQTIVGDVTYNAFGQKTRVALGSGAVTTYSYYTKTKRLKRMQTVDAQAQVIQSLRYFYDPVGNIIRINDEVNGTFEKYHYDHLNRLIRAEGDHYGVKDYQYDTIGNLLLKDGKSYTYGSHVNFNNAGPHAVIETNDGIERVTYTYDANGNMASKQNMTTGDPIRFFIYDAENRLLEINEAAKTIATYRYDGDGGRVSKLTDAGYTEFVGSLYEVHNGVTTSHIYLGEERIASVTNGEIRYFHNNHLGSTHVVTDSSSMVEAEYAYHPFGKSIVVYEDLDTAVNRMYTGQYQDQESGLLFYNARYYDPELGRFISADTIVQSPGNPQTLNRYSYTANNPINYIDPSGHVFIIDDILIGALIGAVIGGTVAAITGGDIWQGVLTGAISGAIFGGIGAYGLEGLEQVGVHIAGGMASGAINSIVTGGDPAMGAAIGGFSAGISQFVGQNVTFLDAEVSNLKEFVGAFIARSAVGAVTGGTTSVIFGGNFSSGAEQGAITAAIAFIANDLNPAHDEDGYLKTKIKEALDSFYNSAIKVGTNVKDFFTDDSYLYVQAWEQFKSDQIRNLQIALTIQSGVSLYGAVRTKIVGVGDAFKKGVKGIQEGVNPKTLTPQKNLAKLDPNRLRRVEIYGKDQAIEVDLNGLVQQGHHRLKNAINAGRSIDVFVK